jgi:hypothetical protein
MVCLALSPAPGAAVSPGPIVERLTATAVTTGSAPESAGRIDIVIERWSTEAERENMLRASGPARLLDALHMVLHRTGFVLSPGVQGLGSRSRGRRARNIQFAHEIKTPAGRQVVIATDQHLGFGDPALTPRQTDYEFTLIDIRFGPDGVGVGKMAPESKVAYNKETKMIELANYGTLPEQLHAVTSEALKKLSF